MSHQFSRQISPRLTFLWLRTQRPAMISEKYTKASSGLHSSTDRRERPQNTWSHWATDLEPMSSTHRTGSQSALVTLGCSRKSRRKRKTMKATVRNSATDGGRSRPKKLAMWGSTRFTDYEFLN